MIWRDHINMKDYRKRVCSTVSAVLLSCLLIVTSVPLFASADGTGSSTFESTTEVNTSMPAFDATVESSDRTTVTVHADPGTFPAGTSVKVSPASSEAAIRAAKGSIEACVVDAAAVDISFIDKSGAEIEPAQGKNVQVMMKADSPVEGDGHELIHIKDDGSAEAVSSTSRVTDKTAQFSADSFSVYAIVGTEDKNKFTSTYEFYDNDGKQISTQKVKSGDQLLTPKVPKTIDGKKFSGWTDASGNYFDSFGKVGTISKDGSTIRLYAKYQDAVYIYYYDQYDNLIKSQQVEPDSTVTIEHDAPLIQVQPLTQCQDGWSTSKNGTNDVSGQYTIGTRSVKLYPILKEGYWISFDTNSRYSIAKQFIPLDAIGDGKKVNRPSSDPSKDGYVFDQWYVDKDLKTPYDFNKDVTEPLTLYAGYKPATDTKYTVRYWIEYQKKAGSSVGDGVWDYMMLADDERTGTTGQKATFDPDLIFSTNYNKSKDGYELNTEKTIAPEIKGDGSTVYNVYYKCRPYDLSITVPKSDGTETTLSYKNVKYSSSLSQLWNDVFAITPESELFDDAHSYHYKSGSGGYISINSGDEFPTMPANNVELTRYEHKPFNCFTKIYAETLNGSAPDGTEAVHNTSLRSQDDEKTYFLYKGAAAYNPRGWDIVHFDLLKGFTPVMGRSDGHYYINDNLIHVYFNYLKDDFVKDHPGIEYNVVYNADGTQHLYSGSDDPIRIYFQRNRYDLVFNTNGGPKVSTKSVLFQDDLDQYDPSSYVVGKTTKTVGNEKFVFDGWYSDPELETRFDFTSHATMPYYNLYLYAKWVPETHDVTFDTGKGSHVNKASDIEYGHTVEKPDDPNYEGHVFLGWTLNGRPYSFESGVTKNITLKAEWRSIKAWPVKYDLNGGNGTIPGSAEKYYEDSGVTVGSADGVTAPEGKVFLGWKCSSDGKLYYPNASIPMAFGGMTLTAQWGDLAKSPSLTYDFNFDQFKITSGGISSETVNTAENNSILDLQDIRAFRNIPSGYVFKGWYLDKECTKGPINKVMVDNLEGNTNRVYAKWNRVYTVSYQDGVSGTVFEPQNYKVESGKMTPGFNGTPKRSGYTFKGWSPKVSDAVTCSVTYYATWEKDVNASSSSSHPTNTPRTGDDQHLDLYLFILTGALTLLIALLLLAKKHILNKNNR